MSSLALFYVFNDNQLDIETGAAYLPLDVLYPLPTMKSILCDATPIAVISIKQLTDTLGGKLTISQTGEGYITS